MDDWGITAYGFNRPTDAELTLAGQSSMKETFGENWNVDDNSRSGMLIKNNAAAQSKVWKGLEAVYFSQTKDGAEGNFLDERYAYFGILRRGETKGTGNVLIETDNTAPDSYEIVKGSDCSGENGLQYLSTEAVAVKDELKAYKIEGATLPLGNYTFTVTTELGSTYSASYSLVGNDDASRLILFNNLKTFFDGIFPDEMAKIYIVEEPNNVAFYAGFIIEGGNNVVVGIDAPFSLKFNTNRIGNRFTQVPTEASEAGYHPLKVGEITSILPTPTGYVSITNIEDFNSGAEVESDAEFTVKGESRSDSPRSSTRPAIIGNMLAVEGVVAFTINKEVTSDGVVRNTPICLGGVTSEIAEELYRTQPVSNSYIGDTAYTVSTEDNSTEVIRFTRAVEAPRSVRVKYTPVDGNSLSNQEVLDIQESVANVGVNINIGGKVFNGQLEGAVFSVNPKRFLTLIVESKGEFEPDSSYTTDDFTPLPEQYPRLSEDRVEVLRV